MGRTAPVLALLSWGVGAAAEPREPLTITKLHDPELVIEQGSVAGGSDAQPAMNTAIFSRAISEAIRAQQQSMRDQCRSRRGPFASMAARWAWQASCSYQRY